MLISTIIRTTKLFNGNISDLEGSKVAFVNPYSYLLLRNRRDISSFDYVFLDGLIFVLLLKLFRISTNRYSFDMTSLAPSVFEYCNKREQSIAFIGGSLSETKRFKQTIEENFEGNYKLHTIHGYQQDSRNYLNFLNKARPKFVVVGMGAPLQEKYVCNLSEQYKATYFTCGAFISQTSKNLYYYPKYIDRYNLRFFYRFFKEPHFRYRLIKYPVGILAFCYDVARHEFSTEKAGA